MTKMSKPNRVERKIIKLCSDKKSKFKHVLKQYLLVEVVVSSEWVCRLHLHFVQKEEKSD